MNYEILGEEMKALGEVKRGRLALFGASTESDYLIDSKALERLSTTELKKLNSFKIPEKKRSFSLGRAAAKEAIKGFFPSVVDHQINVANSADPENAGKPIAYYKNKQLPGCISISHSNELGVAFYHPDKEVGIDLEKVSKRDDTFLKFNFTAEEKTSLDKIPQHHKEEAMTLMWSAKEALSKVVGKGLSLSTLNMSTHIHATQLTNLLTSGEEKFTQTIQFTATLQSKNQPPQQFFLNSRFIYVTSGSVFCLTLAELA